MTVYYWYLRESDGPAVGAWVGDDGEEAQSHKGDGGHDGEGADVGHQDADHPRTADQSLCERREQQTAGQLKRDRRCDGATGEGEEGEGSVGGGVGRPQATGEGEEGPGESERGRRSEGRVQEKEVAATIEMKITGRNWGRRVGS